MNNLILAILLGLATTIYSVNGLSGPFLFWGQQRLKRLQPNSLVKGDDIDFQDLYQNANGIVIFVRNNTGQRLDAAQFPQLQDLIRVHDWAYLPQRMLSVEPFKYNSNVELINLNGIHITEDEEIVNGFKDAVTLYGAGSVLGILANNEDEISQHFISKREAEKATNETDSKEKDKQIYVADGAKAILYANKPPIMSVNKKEIVIQPGQVKEVTFDDQKNKGYSRLNIMFIVDNEKLFLRFNFTILKGTWTLRAVGVEYKDYNNILSLSGNEFTLPSAPYKFSYRCSAQPLIFQNGTDNVTITDYQVQPWLNGSERFGEVIDCVGLTTAPILAGVLVTLFLCGILSIGLVAIYDIKTPNKFESSRDKQLTFTIQE